ncbi:putative troponin c, isotype gamma [Cardiosporidium cionae]|uniref:Calmodulin n=1 Tax=Cardiosporidium cionae TaxID=476202 RepID=A0ABQ7J8P4_9APIC|nr:putative troponin c, isotype gamma [Cardiosporidium cionae]|eukprot:KAF8820347.1 putative troponin c, isotype gamma [Cardiosporidium cionae]
MDATFLSKQRRVELKTAFALFDKNKNGKIDGKQMLYLLKSIGVKIDSRDEKALILEHGERGDFTYEDLLTVGEVVYNDVQIESTVVEALRELHPSTNESIPVKMLRELLLKIGLVNLCALGLGIKLTEKEVDMFLGIECEARNAKEINYGTFVSSPSSRLHYLHVVNQRVWHALHNSHITPWCYLND